jgi:LacI family transcriptional regulator
MRRSLVLGLLVPDASNPFFAQFAKAVEDAAFAQGYTLLVGNASDSAERETFYLQAFAERQVDGLLLMSVGNSDESVRQLKGSTCPLVVVDRLIPGIGATTIIADHEAGGFLATSHLVAHGHKRIAYLGGPSEFGPSVDRHRGWVRALREAGLPIDESLLVRSPLDRQGGYQATLELLRRERQVTALFACTDTQAIGAFRAAAELSLRIPDDFAIVGFDGTADSGFTVPGLTTVAQPFEALGRRAVESVLRRIRNADERPTEEILPVDLIVRGSCGCHDPLLPTPADAPEDPESAVAERPPSQREQPQ